MVVRLDLSKELPQLAEEIFNRVEPCFNISQTYREAERLASDMRDECCGSSDEILCQRTVRTFENRLNLGLRGAPGHIPKPVAERLSNEMDKVHRAWRKEILTRAPRAAGAPEEVLLEMEELPDCSESDLLLDGIEKFLRWQSNLAFAECVCERGLLR